MYATTILLIAPEIAGSPVADSIRKQLDSEVQLVPNRRSAVAALRRNDYALIVLEENLITSDPEAIDHLYKAAGAALLLEVNFAISSPDRIVRQVRSALTRRAHDRAQARTAAAASLQSELGTTLAGLLLESELALREAAPAQQPKLRHVVELASDLRNRLRA
jgi:signal transduction histidine kinase